MKFRVWNKECKYFIKPESFCYLRFSIRMDGELHCENPSGTYYKADDYWIIQYFTGIKDRNGIEIYEGDILTSFNSRMLYEVIWDIYEKSHAQYVGFKLKCFDKENNFKPYLSKWGEPVNQSFEINNPTFEIIGNIFENTELLKL